MTMRTIWILLLAGSTALAPGVVLAQDTAAVNGTWEGPWYRGMSSGRAKLQIAGNGGTLQLTNAETFGEAPQPLVTLAVDADAVSLRANGESGLPLTLDLKLNAKGDQMKGMGKYEGFGVRMELRRTGG
jgi:hypothetical protein